MLTLMAELNTGRSSVGAFIRYLSENEIVDEAAARRALDLKGRVDLRIGPISLLQGFVTPEEINGILWIQRDAQNKKFGEIAVEMGVMTQDEVKKSLELQQDDLFAFCQSVILDGLIAPQTLFALLKTFLEQDFDRTVEHRRIGRHTRVIKSIRDMLKKITVVAPMPGNVARLLQMLNDPKVNLDEFAKVVSIDVALTAMLLRLANSAFYGLKSEAATVHKAVTVLGIKKLRQLILSAALMTHFKSLHADRLFQFWERSFRAAQWAKELAKESGQEEIDEFFIAGFLHDIGELVMLQYFPEEVRRIDEIAASGKSMVESELQVMGCDRSDIGSYLLSLWQLPGEVIESAMLAHHPRIHLQQISRITQESKVVNMAVAIVHASPNVNMMGQKIGLGQIVEDYKPIIRLTYSRVKELNEGIDQSLADMMRWIRP